MADESARRKRLRNLLRVLLRDRPELNRLSGMLDFEDDDLDAYLELSLFDWNATPPVTLTAANIEAHPSEAILLFGAAVMACRSDAVREARNPFAFTDGGTQMTPQSKPQTYHVAMSELERDYRLAKMSAKANINISRGWGGVASDYWWFDVGGTTR